MLLAGMSSSKSENREVVFFQKADMINYHSMNSYLAYKLLISHRFM
jgi:hypothetical protein